MYKSIYGEQAAFAFIKVFGSPFLRKTGADCMVKQFYHFFFRQYRAALQPGRIPVTPVDHPLDGKIPFTPSWVHVYLDFVGFWLRVIGFLHHTFARRSDEAIEKLILSVRRIYLAAAGIYGKNLSTTSRPFYIASPHFFFIHLLDPHLLCIPSLHVMVVINAHIQFRDIVRGMGREAEFFRQTKELERGAAAITESLLYVKQHSINCVAAAMYVLTCVDRRLFPEEEAEAFVSRLFSGAAWAPRMPKTRLPEEDGRAVREHILSMYRRFIEEGHEAKTWEAPLLDFLRSLQGKNGKNNANRKGPAPAGRTNVP
ncbi:MAG: hypothetical protein LBK08_08400 [Treponema sp.]|jgi:hypothetical protein|nr:hypothetical protein [Treponema sp.]